MNSSFSRWGIALVVLLGSHDNSIAIVKRPQLFPSRSASAAFALPNHCLNRRFCPPRRRRPPMAHAANYADLSSETEARYSGAVAAATVEPPRDVAGDARQGVERDAEFMRRALELAAKGLGQTRPNPAVGCVILDREGVVVGEGFHPRAGEPHAEGSLMPGYD